MAAAMKNGTDTRESLGKVKVEKKRQTYHSRVDVITKLRAYAYWERLGISEIVNAALEQFFADKEVRSLPPKEERAAMS